MRVLHVIASVDPAGGGPIEGIIRQWQALADYRKTEIVSLDPPDAPFLKDSPMQVHPLGTGRYRGRSTSKLARFGLTPRLVPWLRDHACEYDLIVINGLWSYASVGASLILPNSRTPYVVYPHGMLDPWFRKTYPFKHVLKQVLWLLFEGRLLSHAQATLFTSEDEMASAAGQFHGHRYKQRVVPYGTLDPPAESNAEHHAFRAQLPALGNRKYVLFLSRIHPKKGCDILIRSWSAVCALAPDVDLIIAGPDQEGWTKKLQELGQSLGLAHRLHWPGMLTGAAKWGAYRGAEAFILPSHQENFGLVVAEAMACRSLVLISDKVNIWREVKGAGAGIVATDDEAGVTSMLKAFFAMDQPARSTMRSAARDCFQKHFDLNTSALSVLALFRELAKRGG